MSVENVRLRENEKILLDRLKRCKEEKRREKRKFQNMFNDLVDRLVEQENSLQNVSMKLFLYDILIYFISGFASENKTTRNYFQVFGGSQCRLGDGEGKGRNCFEKSEQVDRKYKEN